MSYTSLMPLIRKTGSTLSAPDFHNIVNVVFHNEEASYYDALHKGMWDSLQEQVNLLAADAMQAVEKSRKLRLLDIGCGTGLSSQMLLESPLGPQIEKVTLADTSIKMLQQAEKKAAEWVAPYEIVNADISGITGKYDIILVSSVLHHIPDLDGFLQHVNRLQNNGGVFIHLQDPNGDYFNDGEYLERVAEYEKTIRTSDNSGIVKKLRKTVKRFIGRKDYIDRVNDELLRLNAIKKRMSAQEIWSVTDIHVEDLPFSTGNGISLKFLSKHLIGYKNISRRSYGFFGPLKSELSAEFQLREEQLIRENFLNGRHIAGTWQKSTQE